MNKENVRDRSKRLENKSMFDIIIESHIGKDMSDNKGCDNCGKY